MTSALRSLGLRERVAVGILLVACVAWAAIALFVPGQHGPSPAPGTPQQIAASRAMLQTLPAVAGANVDPYDTACEQPQTWCLTSATLTPQQLTAAALAVLRSSGASVSSHSCEKSHTAMLLCRATLQYRGTRLTLSSDAPLVALSLSASTDSRTTLAVSVDGAAPATVLEPLRSWASINPLPKVWPVRPPCVTKPARGTGCEVYQVDSAKAPAFPGTLEVSTATAVAALKAHGFAVHRTCIMTQQPVGPHCILNVKKFRSPGGGDGLTGTISVRERSASTVSVSVYLAQTAS
jgi:hypothetical protein